MPAPIRPVSARPHRDLRLAGAVLLSFCLAATAACGSVTSASAIGDAKRDLNEAKGLEGEDNAPYEYTRAATYLQKAKELNGMGHYEAAAEFARQSQLASEKALDVARLAQDRQKRKEKFAPKKSDDKDKKGVPGFTPSGEE